MRVLSVISTKGGVGKTIAASRARRARPSPNTIWMPSRGTCARSPSPVNTHSDV